MLFNLLLIDDRSRAIQCLISYSKLCILLSFAGLLYSKKYMTNKDICSFLLIFSQCFTCCYIEETISFLSKSNPDNTVFIFCYFILSCALASIFILKFKSCRYYIIVFSSLHFILRVGSIVWNISSGTDVSIFF